MSETTKATLTRLPETPTSKAGESSSPGTILSSALPLKGKRVATVLFSSYPDDPRPRRTAEAMVGAGMTVEMICIRESSTEPEHEVFNGVDIRRIRIARERGGVVSYFRQYSTFLSMAFAILTARSMRRHYDMVYIHNMPDVLVLSGLIPKLFGAKLVLDLHDPMPELMMTIFELPPTDKWVGMLKRAEKWSMSLVDSVVTVNLACQRLFASRSCKSEKITVIMNSPDEKIFQLRPPAAHIIARDKGKPFVIMYHGSLVERNGLGLAVDALAIVHSMIPNVELRIYGSTNPYLERVMAKVRSLGLEKVVRFNGPKPIEQIVKAIDECDIGVIPNQRNIFTELNTPTRIFEYLALGKPVIAPRAPGICDYFDDEALIYFELGNAEDLAKKLVFAFNNPEKVVEIARRGQDVHQEHMWREEKLRLIELTSRLLCGVK